MEFKTNIKRDMCKNDSEESEKEKLIKNIFKWISFAILIIVSITTLLALVAQGLENGTKITDKIYDINCFLCVTSIISAVMYIIVNWLYKQVYEENKPHKNSTKDTWFIRFVKNNKEKIKNVWPCILLVIFMIWTAIGCIQAANEASAEAFLKENYEEYVSIVTKVEDDLKDGKIDNSKLLEEKEELEKNLKQNLEIANITSGNRMPNAADRSWNGCENLKDGYYSFLFYAMVVVNVILLGAKSDNLKHWILRVLLVSALIIVFLSFLNLLMPTIKFVVNSETEKISIQQDIVNFKKAIFNNSNHYGYYLCIATMLSAILFLKEKNIYFKGIALIGFVLTTFMLIVNNTFGSYLGVMATIAMMFIFALVGMLSRGIKAALHHYKDEKEKLKIVLEKFKFSVVEFSKIALLSGIFAFLSITLVAANSDVFVEGDYICKKSYINFTFGERNIVIKDNGSQTILKNTTFDVSGDNRIYNVNEKTLKFVKDIEKDEKKEYCKLNGETYEILKDQTTTKLKEKGEFSERTIVKANFDGLFKDIGIILGINDSDVNDEKDKDNDASSEFSGETSEELITEESSEEEVINEKSGLSEAVSNTGSGRGEVWIKSLDLIEQRPVFGWGLENLLNEFYYQYDINEGRTHNLILQLAGTTGIIGMLLYVGAVIAIFFKVLFNCKFRNHTKTTRIILLLTYVIAWVCITAISKTIIDEILMRFIILFVFVVLSIFAIKSKECDNKIKVFLIFVSAMFAGALYILSQIVINKLLINIIITLIFEITLIFITNIKSINLKVSEWGIIEYVAMPTFVAYMISSLFGNSAFYTSPYFMIILGMMIASMIYKSNSNIEVTEKNMILEKNASNVKSNYNKKKKK